MKEIMISIKNILIPLAFPISLTIYIVLNLISNLHYTASCVLTQGCLHFYNAELPANIIFALIATWVFTIIIIIASFSQGYGQETYNEICLLTSFFLFIAFFFINFKTNLHRQNHPLRLNPCLFECFYPCLKRLLAPQTC